jgi:hypothetical protein
MVTESTSPPKLRVNQSGSTIKRGAVCALCGGYELWKVSFCVLRSHWAGGKRVWVLGMPEGDLRSFVICVFLNCSEVTCPNPSLVFGGSETFPISTPRLTGLTRARCRGGEQIPQVSVIMLVICGTVHRASLKPSELI